MWQLLGVFISGFCMGGLAFALRKFSKNKLPSWLVPAAAGISMLGFLAYYDYTWYDYKVEQLQIQLIQKNLPQDTYTLVAEDRKTDFFRPWSYLITPITSFTFIDGEFLEFSQNNQQLVQYISYEFKKEYVDKLETRTLLLNCTSAEQVELDDKYQAKLPVVVEKIAKDGALFSKLCLGSKATSEAH